jgi:murein DD-endopeptidase MepM/ murein hydrolase activator NlpD
MGEAGQDTDQNGDYNGLGLGIGGAAITPQQTAALRSQIAAEKKAEWKQKSVFARMFDTSDTNSTVSQLAIRVPTSVPQLAMVPTILQESLFSIISPNTFAGATPKDQFGFDFAYSYSDSELAADPAKYNNDTCTTYAQEREDSYKGMKDTGGKFPIMVYTKTDPCALEKVVIASAKAPFTSEPDPNFQLGANPTNTTSVLPPTYAPGTWVWPADGPIKQGYHVYNVSRQGTHKGIDIAEAAGTAVLVAHDGVVVGGGMTYDDPNIGRIVTIQVNGVSPALYMVYQHLSPTGPLPSGPVRAGTVLGKVASTREVSSYYLGPYTHVHFQLQTTKTFIVGYSTPPSMDTTKDPLSYLPPR